MLKQILTGCFLLMGLAAMGQNVYWASTVIDFSSELSPDQNGAIQATGEPNVKLNEGGFNPNAWSPRRTDKDDFIKVGFDKPMRIQQIAIHESNVPGAVTRVFTYDANDNEYLMFDLEPKSIPLKSRLLNIFFEMTEHEVHAIKVEIDGKAVEGENAIDAIGMSDSNIPISVTIRIAENVNEEIVVERLGKNINTKYAEHNPILSPDGKTLFFSRSNDPKNVGGIDDEDIWYSELDEETGRLPSWGAPNRLVITG